MIAVALVGAACFAAIALICAHAAGREEWSDIDIADAEFLRGLNQQQHAGEVQSHRLWGVSVGGEIDNIHVERF